jgi:putative ABC transport system substrate-binding protein
MHRRDVVIATFAIGVLRHSEAQQAATMRRVGVLFFQTESLTAPQRSSFVQGMRDLGWMEGRNVEYRFAYPDGDARKVDLLVADLIGQNVDVIVTGSSQGTLAAKRATATIPIVMAAISNAVGNGFVASLAKPGGNITGISNQQDEILGKQVSILHEISPAARRIAIVLNEGNPSHALYWAEAQRACAMLGLVPLRIVANAPDRLAEAAEQLIKLRADAVVVMQDGVYNVARVRLQELIARTRLPAIYGQRELVQAGGLVSYAADLPGNFRAAARYVDKILRGAKPADLPVEQPTKFELVVNASTARRLGITIPSSLLLRADEILES